MTVVEGRPAAGIVRFDHETEQVVVGVAQRPVQRAAVLVVRLADRDHCNTVSQSGRRRGGEPVGELLWSGRSRRPIGNAPTGAARGSPGTWWPGREDSAPSSTRRLGSGRSRRGRPNVAVWPPATAAVLWWPP